MGQKHSIPKKLKTSLLNKSKQLLSVKQFTVLQTIEKFLSLSTAKVLTILSLGSALYFYYPRVDVLKIEDISPYDPFKNPFFVYNSGNIPVENLEYYFSIPHVVFTDGVKIGAGEIIPKNREPDIGAFDFDLKHNEDEKILGGIIITEGHDDIKRLDTNRKSLIHLNNAADFRPNIREATLIIRYSYQLPYWPYRFQDNASFVLIKTYNDKYVWLDNNQK